MTFNCFSSPPRMSPWATTHLEHRLSGTAGEACEVAALLGIERSSQMLSHTPQPHMGHGALRGSVHGRSRRNSYGRDNEIQVWSICSAAACAGPFVPGSEAPADSLQGWLVLASELGATPITAPGPSSAGPIVLAERPPGCPATTRIDSNAASSRMRTYLPVMGGRVVVLCWLPTFNLDSSFPSQTVILPLWGSRPLRMVSRCALTLTL